jgi:hypothetical protein
MNGLNTSDMGFMQGVLAQMHGVVSPEVELM